MIKVDFAFSRSSASAFAAFKFSCAADSLPLYQATPMLPASVNTPAATARTSGSAFDHHGAAVERSFALASPWRTLSSSRRTASSSSPIDASAGEPGAGAEDSFIAGHLGFRDRAKGRKLKAQPNRVFRLPRPEAPATPSRP